MIGLCLWLFFSMNAGIRIEGFKVKVIFEEWMGVSKDKIVDFVLPESLKVTDKLKFWDKCFTLRICPGIGFGLGLFLCEKYKEFW